MSRIAEIPGHAEKIKQHAAPKWISRDAPVCALIHCMKDNDRKARQNDNFDFVSPEEQRKYRRVRSSAFQGVPVVLEPAPPFFGSPVEGKMADLSGGGVAVILKEAILVKTKMKLWMVLPDREAISCTVSVRRVSPVKAGFLTGLQFLDMADPAASALVSISTDYDACEVRIRHETPPICVRSCSFFTYCDKPQKQSEKR